LTDLRNLGVMQQQNNQSSLLPRSF